ncbi:MAG: hypothetical protein V4734_06870, partial [Terriglobus sp.]
MPPVVLPGRLLRAAASLCFVAVTALPVFAKDQVPDWVKAAAQTPTDKVSNEANAVVLMQEHTYTVDSKGVLVQHVRRVVKILRPQGRK